MKKFLSICCMLLCAVLLFSCTGKKMRGDFGGTPASLMLNYIGGAINDPNHTFTKDEFEVTMVFSDSSTRVITDYKLRQERAEGCFEIFATWGDLEGYRIIPIQYDPSIDPEFVDPADHETMPETIPSADTDDAAA